MSSRIGEPHQSSYRVREPHRSCPFDATHQILPHRMAQHIIKCRKNHKGMEMKTCTFNATHIISPAEYQSHILECPDKAIVERSIYRFPDIGDALDNIKKEGNKQCSKTVCDEDWDQELAEKADNAKVVKKYNFTRPPPPGMMGKSGKREWRLAEIDRVKKIEKIYTKVQNKSYISFNE